MTANYLNSTGIEQTLVSQPAFQRQGMLGSWIKDLEEIVDRQENPESTLMLGRAVVIEFSDLLAGREMLPEIALIAGMRYAIPKIEDIRGWLSNEGELFPEGGVVDTPVLAYVPIECFIKSDEKGSRNQYGWDVPSCSEFIQAIHEINQKIPIVIVTMGKFLDVSDELRAAYAFDRYITIPKSDPIERTHEFVNLVGIDSLDESVTKFPEKVGMLLNMRFPDKRRLGLLEMTIKRMHKKSKRPISYRDLVLLAARGTGEGDYRPHIHEKNRYRTAVHEAGHTLVAMVDSKGINVPDYVSILKGNGFLGITLESYEYHYQQLDCDAYQTGRHSVRVALGGRAAEEVILGNEQIGTSGLRSDLEEVSSITRGFFAVHGICVNMEQELHTGSNLAAIVSSESASEAAHIEAMMRTYIEQQYRIAIETVKSNRALLDQITEKLLSKEELYQDDLLPMLEKVG